ncbi:MAG: hypothetical protein U0174_23170 [Polyangiaceae bacterium]
MNSHIERVANPLDIVARNRGDRLLADDWGKPLPPNPPMRGDVADLPLTRSEKTLMPLIGRLAVDGNPCGTLLPKEETQGCILFGLPLCSLLLRLLPREPEGTPQLLS